MDMRVLSEVHEESVYLGSASGMSPPPATLPPPELSLGNGTDKMQDAASTRG